MTLFHSGQFDSAEFEGGIIFLISGTCHIPMDHSIWDFEVTKGYYGGSEIDWLWTWMFFGQKNLYYGNKNKI